MSVHGYANDEYKLNSEKETAAKDAQLLKENGYDVAVLQERIKSIFATVFDEEKKAAPKWSFEYEIGDVKIEYSLAKARCRFSCDWDTHVTIAPRKYTLLNKKTGETINTEFDDHSIHQIVNHGFFGHGTYRIDPLLLARIILEVSQSPLQKHIASIDSI